jgi:2-keto-4-pentenoate hydratase/2-oxohepta-3-ene-1,7-dioic acid hydratase in catechol pathway
MRLLTYLTDDGPQLGVLRGEAVVPVPGLDMLALIEARQAGLSQAGAASGAALPVSALRLLAPIPTPRRNVFCVGLNYLAHAQEGADARGVPLKLPERPLFFTKATLAVTGPYDDIPFDDNVSVQIDWEVELGVVIGRAGKNIPSGEALDYVFGYTVLNDVSARDLQNGHGGQFFKGKSLDGTCPMGPVIVTADEVADPHNLPVRCRVNNVLKQDSTTAEFIFNIPTVIEWLSKGMTLLPGDVIATGTPAGVGFARNPPEFLKPGDVVECEVEGLGVIRNHVVAVS